MAKVMMCDACKQIFVTPRSVDDDILRNRVYWDQATNCVKVRGQRFDLCDDCLEIFFKWVGYD